MIACFCSTWRLLEWYFVFLFCCYFCIGGGFQIILYVHPQGNGHFLVFTSIFSKRAVKNHHLQYTQFMLFLHASIQLATSDLSSSLKLRSCPNTSGSLSSLDLRNLSWVFYPLNPFDVVGGMNFTLENPARQVPGDCVFFKSKHFDRENLPHRVVSLNLPVCEICAPKKPTQKQTFLGLIFDTQTEGLGRCFCFCCEVWKIALAVGHELHGKQNLQNSCMQAFLKVFCQCRGKPFTKKIATTLHTTSIKDDDITISM